MYEPAGQLVVEVWADLVCPWCFIAKHRLRQAVAAYEHPATVVLRHRAFELEPGLPPGQRVPVAQHLGDRYGGGIEAGRAMTARVAEVAAAEGMVLDFDRAVTCSTFDAHRLVALAAQLGGWELAQAAVERFFAAHFQQGLAVDDHGVLVRIAAEAGLDEQRVAAVLAGDMHADAVRADEAAGRARGIGGVPYALADGRVALGGAQPVEVYLQLLRQAGGVQGQG